MRICKSLGHLSEAVLLRRDFPPCSPPHPHRTRPSASLSACVREVEGLVHISTLPDDYYYYEEATHSLLGRRSGRCFRLGGRVKVQVVRVDLQRRQLDLRVVGGPPPAPVPKPEVPKYPLKHKKRR